MGGGGGASPVTGPVSSPVWGEVKGLFRSGGGVPLIQSGVCPLWTGGNTPGQATARAVHLLRSDRTFLLLPVYEV